MFLRVKFPARPSGFRSSMLQRDLRGSNMELSQSLFPDGNSHKAVCARINLQRNLRIVDGCVTHILARTVIDLCESVFVYVQSQKQAATFAQPPAHKWRLLEWNGFNPARCQKFSHAHILSITGAAGEITQLK